MTSPNIDTLRKVVELAHEIAVGNVKRKYNGDAQAWMEGSARRRAARYEYMTQAPSMAEQIVALLGHIDTAYKALQKATPLAQDGIFFLASRIDSTAEKRDIWREDLATARNTMATLRPIAELHEELKEKK